MGFHARYLPAVPELKEQLKQHGLVAFANMYIHADALVGSDESIKFVDKQINKHLKTIKNKL